MRKLTLFSLLFVVTFILALVQNEVIATVGFHGVVLAETQDFPDPNKPGFVKSYSMFYAWYPGNYGLTGVDYIQTHVRLRLAGGVIVTSALKACGNSTKYNHRTHDGSAPIIDKTCWGILL